MKKNYFLIFLLAVFNLSCHACFKALFAPKEEKSVKKLEKRKKKVQEWNTSQNMTISISENKSCPSKIERYILSSDLENITWEVEVSHASPRDCLEVKKEEGIFQNPTWHPDEDPCYCQWALEPKNSGEAILKLSQIEKTKAISQQWIKVTITD